MADYELAIEIDARGSHCPGPMMELIKAVRQADVGEYVAVLSSDEGSVQDIPAWVKKAKHELVEIIEGDGYRKFVVKKLH